MRFTFGHWRIGLRAWLPRVWPTRQFPLRRPVRPRWSAAVIESLEQRFALASAPSLVVDINQVRVPVDPDHYAAVGDVTYFAATTSEAGRELWRTDGTEAGTVLVIDLEPGMGGSDPRELTIVGSTLFFTATENGSEELWKSDGTAAGTQRLRPSGESPRVLFPRELTAAGGELFFSAYESPSGRELWKTDGTFAGTVMVRDLYPGSGWDNSFFGEWTPTPLSGYPRWLTPYQDKVCFVADTPNEGLWISDGTEAGTTRIHEFTSQEGMVEEFVVVGDTLYFAASTESGSREIWKTDGTSAGTIPVVTVIADSDHAALNAIGEMVSFGGGILFAADDGVSGREPWYSDGTPEGTRRIADLNPASGAGSNPFAFTVVDGVGYFYADDGTYGWELWRTDGTAAGTSLVRDINPGSGRAFWPSWDSDRRMIDAGGRVLFSADSGNGLGAQVWSSDGTSEGTTAVSRFTNGSGDAFDEWHEFGTVLDGFAYFTADDGLGRTAVWRSDGTTGGTRLVAELTEKNTDLRILDLQSGGGKVFISVWGNPIGSSSWARLYATDGSDAPPVLLDEGMGNDYDESLFLDGVWFSKRVNGKILRSDGTPDGTYEVDDATVTSFGSPEVSGFAVVGDRLYYQKLVEPTYDDERYSIWAADAEGNVEEIVPWESYGDYPVKSIHAAGSKPIFAWYDGSGEGSMMTLAAGGGMAVLAEDGVDESIGWYGGGVTIGGTLYYTFLRYAAVEGDPDVLELRATDGTPEGTRTIAPLMSGADDPWNAWAMAMHPFGTGFVFETEETSGYEEDEVRTRSFWVSDGTAAGTKALVTGIDGIDGIDADKIIYRATGTDGVSRLYVSDGSVEGTEAIPAVSLQADSDPVWIATIKDRFLMVATDADHGRELFVYSDATVPGAPSGLTATTGDSMATLAWTAPSLDGGSAVIDYVVQSSSDGGATWANVADGVSAATSVTVGGLVNGTSYLFRVAALNAVGVGSFGVPSAAVRPEGVPGRPMSLIVNPGDGKVTLSWTAPSSDGGRPIVNYTIESSDDDGKTWKAVARPVSADATAMLAGLKNGASYRFRVSAVSSLGAGPSSLPSVSVIPSKPASMPTALAVVRGDSRVTLSWKVPSSNGGSPIVDYVVQSSTDGGKNWSSIADGVSNANSTTVAGLVNGTAYVFRVAAVNSVGAGAFSAKSAVVTPAMVAGVPRDLSVVRGNGRVAVGWKAPTSDGGLPITQYAVESSVDGGKTWKAVGKQPASATATTVKGLVNGTPYVFRVAAVNGVGGGPFTPSSATVVPATAPGMPTGVVAMRGDRLVNLVWKAPAVTGGAAITDYRVERSADGGKTWVTADDGISTVTSVTVTGLINGTTYVFRISAANSVGFGTPSPKSAAVTPATLPGEPTGLVATRAAGKVTLAWKAPASTGGTAFVDYTIEWSTDGGSSWKAATRKRSPATNAILAGMSISLAYRFRVAAVNAVGRGAFVEASLAGTMS